MGLNAIEKLNAIMYVTNLSELAQATSTITSKESLVLED
jgi:hypothetical protein